MSIVTGHCASRGQLGLLVVAMTVLCARCGFRDSSADHTVKVQDEAEHLSQQQMESDARKNASLTHDTAVAGFDVPDTTPQGRSAPSAFKTLRAVWSIGVAEGRPEEEFGQVVGVALDADENVYVLDAATFSIRVFNRNGDFRYAFGRAGRGPGELAEPKAIHHDGVRTLYVLDAVNGILTFHTAADGAMLARSIRLPLIAKDFCVTGSRIFLFGLSGEQTVHEIDHAGRIVMSFGGLFGPIGNSAQRLVSGDGKIGCVGKDPTVIATSAILPDVRAYDGNTGGLLWTDSVRGFVGTVIKTQADGRYSMWAPEGGAAQYVSIREVAPGDVLVQARRAPTPRQIRESGADPSEQIVSCVMDVRRGGCRQSTQSMPLLVAAARSRIVTMTNTLYPVLVMNEVQ